jgi:3-oxoacyl-[acyl-carrier protein] reductase
LAAARRPVVVADLDGAKAQVVADEIEAGSGRAIAVQVDVSEPASVGQMAEAASAIFPLEVLVNNAAVFSTLRLGPFEDITVEEWNHVLGVNLTGAFLCCRALVPQMCDRGYGKVINVSSASVFTGRAGYLHYVSSKAALIGFTRALASEVGPRGVRVNAISPGSTETEVERATITHQARLEMAQATALRRVQVPDDLTGTVVFLASSASDFITGQTLNVDGGFAFH